MKQVNHADAFAFYLRTRPELPEAVREYRFVREVIGNGPGLRQRLAEAGLHDWIFDFAWVCHRVAVEIDGASHMVREDPVSGRLMVGGRHNGDDDRHKGNVAAALGWRLLHFTPQMLADNPDGALDLLARALAQGNKSQP